MTESRFRDFDAFEAEHAGTFGFRVGGRTFDAAVSAMALFRLARAEQEGGLGGMTAVQDFCREAVMPDQREAFDEAASVLSIQGMRELSRWLVEMATGAPFDAATASPKRRSRSGGVTKIVNLSTGEVRHISRSAKAS